MKYVQSKFCVTLYWFIASSRSNNLVLGNQFTDSIFLSLILFPTQISFLYPIFHSLYRVPYPVTHSMFIVPYPTAHSIYSIYLSLIHLPIPYFMPHIIQHILSLNLLPNQYVLSLILLSIPYVFSFILLPIPHFLSLILLHITYILALIPWLHMSIHLIRKCAHAHVYFSKSQKRTSGKK